MNTALLRAYHALPAPARAAAATLHGLRLRHWRYGPETERLVGEAFERETWTAAQWHAWREERLGRVLDRAATKVPFYRALWSARRQRGDRASPELLENWPILEKAQLRADPRAFVAEDCDVRRMYREETSGSTGTPLRLWWSRATVRAWYALFDARCRRWHGVSRADRWAIFGGQPVVPIAARRPPYWVWNAGLRQLYLSSYHLAPATVPLYVDALARYRVRYIFAYPSTLDAFARVILEQGIRPAPIAVAIINAEPLFPAQRLRIAEAFGCPVRETYGMAEIVVTATECASGTLHLWPDIGITEMSNAGGPGAAGATGEVIGTGLLNADMPLIRYRVGDRAALGGVGCGCGRTLPILASVEGRSDEMLRTVDGRWVGRLGAVFAAGLRIEEGQIVQDALDRVRVRVVPAAGFGQSDRDAIADGVRIYLGDMRIDFEEVASIERGANGKFRMVVCNVGGAAR